MATKLNNHNLFTNGIINVNNGQIFIDGSPIVSGGGGSPQDVLSDVIGNINYIGVSLAGSLESASVWQIYKTTYASDGNISESVIATNVAWNDRLTATYS